MSNQAVCYKVPIVASDHDFEMVVIIYLVSLLDLINAVSVVFLTRCDV